MPLSLWGERQDCFIVVRHLAVAHCFVAGYRTALSAPEDEHDAFLTVQLIAGRSQQTLARIRTVAWIDIHMLTRKTMRAVISAPRRRGRDLTMTEFANKGLIDMCKSALHCPPLLCCLFTVYSFFFKTTKQSR